MFHKFQVWGNLSWQSLLTDLSSNGLFECTNSRLPGHRSIRLISIIRNFMTLWFCLSICKENGKSVRSISEPWILTFCPMIFVLKGWISSFCFSHGLILRGLCFSWFPWLIETISSILQSNGRYAILKWYFFQNFASGRNSFRWIGWKRVLAR